MNVNKVCRGGKREQNLNVSWIGDQDQESLEIGRHKHRRTNTSVSNGRSNSINLKTERDNIRQKVDAVIK